MHQSADEAIWLFARDQGFIIVSKDDDFHQRSFLYGWPPKIVWIRYGNCTTADIANGLRRHVGIVAAFVADEQASFLALK